MPISEFSTEQFDLQWYKRFKRGWSTEINGSFRGGRDVPPSWRDVYQARDFAKGFIKRIAIRKVNCCTTFEAGWRTGINEFYLNVYLNALPQYPGTYLARRPFDDEYEDEYLFPIDPLRNDILLDMFGISSTYGF